MANSCSVAILPIGPKSHKESQTHEGLMLSVCAFRESLSFCIEIAVGEL
jgi:hypothetical protein